MTRPPNDPYARNDHAMGAPDPRHAPRGEYVARDAVVTPEQERLATEPGPNPVAGVLLIIGGLMGVLAGLIPSGGSKIPLAATIDLFQTGDVNAIVLGAAIILVFLAGLGALAVGAQMFAPKWHGGPSRTGMTMGILMIIASLALIIVVGTAVFDSGAFYLWLLLLACIPTIIGALVGFARK